MRKHYQKSESTIAESNQHENKSRAKSNAKGSNSKNWRLREQTEEETVQTNDDKKSTSTNILYATLPTLAEFCLLYIGKNAQKFFFPTSKDEAQKYVNKSLHQELLDSIFQYASSHETIKFSQWKLFLHPLLEKLNFSHYTKETNDSFIERWVLPNVRPMADLVVSDWEEIDRESIHQIHQGTINLTHLSLAGCVRVSPHIINQIVSECPSLLHLDLSRCTQFSHLIISSANLQSLDLSHTNCTFELKCPNLIRLKIAYCRKMESLTQLSQLKRLESLDVSDRMIGNARHLSALLTIVGRMISLEDLSLRDIGMNNNDLQYLITGQSLRQLKTLNLSGNRITNEGIEVALKAWLFLEEIDISFCPLVVIDEAWHTMQMLNHHCTLKFAYSIKPLNVTEELEWWNKK